MAEPHCPKCGGLIEYDDCIDTEHDMEYDDIFVCTYTGHCTNPRCNAQYTWVEDYEYKRFRNLTENN